MKKYILNRLFNRLKFRIITTVTIFNDDKTVSRKNVEIGKSDEQMVEIIKGSLLMIKWL
jgi:hypothetical protein